LPALRTLLIADCHLGKATSFAALGVPLSASMLGTVTTTDLARMLALVHQLDAQHLVVLGDLIHARSGRDPSLHSALERFGQGLARTTTLTLVRGNHDDRAGDPPPAAGFTCLDEPHIVHQAGSAPLVFRHHPPDHPPPDPAAQLIVCGHVHPAVTLIEPTGRRERCPCFWLSQGVLVLPAFGSFTGAKVVRPRDDDRVFAVGPGEVLRVR
jgi:DNA ligase-associated metallophosphoesterase